MLPNEASVIFLILSTDSTFLDEVFILLKNQGGGEGDNSLCPNLLKTYRQTPLANCLDPFYDSHELNPRCNLEE